MELVSVFNVKLNIPNIKEKNEFMSILNTYEGTDDDKTQVIFIDLILILRLQIQWVIYQLRNYY